MANTQMMLPMMAMDNLLRKMCIHPSEFITDSGRQQLLSLSPKCSLPPLLTAYNS